ncbi:Aste57867_3727 [Aphanomyces stellatus]|uniref:Aste57867_3727 protein n=1 Tax=Aphanomyces stellatus TaxID=120398 RepID=A0A485KEN9_9STRA|nr:hypothetical protein As57867_003716 [Aphanomyces stellatus]VFT80880.1 Aste57867_3727 [Aphanomyces stellatus]
MDDDLATPLDNMTPYSQSCQLPSTTTTSRSPQRMWITLLACLALGVLSIISHVQPTHHPTAFLRMVLANDTSTELDTVFTRAAIVYLPSTDNGKYLNEFRWFHKSWTEMVLQQPPKWRTDIIVFTDGADVPLLHELGCTEVIRMAATDANACVVVYNYKKVKSAEFNYGFADSINVVAVDQAATDPYDWILRTDMDTFMTPAFATWKPPKLTVGSVGGYCFDGYDTCDHLLRIARKLNLTDPTVQDVGSTWYGPAKLIQQCAKLSMQVVNHLHQHEFNETEKSAAYGITGWPRWHYGVLTMYSGHMAIPHCTKDVGGFDKRNDLIDYPTYATDKLSDHMHLHTYQGGGDFNKFLFQAGAYDSVDLSTLDQTTVSGYSMYIALTANHRGVTAPQNKDGPKATVGDDIVFF